MNCFCNVIQDIWLNSTNKQCRPDERRIVVILQLVFCSIIIAILVNPLKSLLWYYLQVKVSMTLEMIFHSGGICQVTS